MKNSSKIVAVIPAHNEAERIGGVIREVKKYVDKVIVVDDGSSDSTSLIAKNKGVETITLKENRGVGFATRVGCDRAVSIGADYIITIDGDGQHEPSEIVWLLNELASNKLDIVFGSRERDCNMPLTKRLGNAFLSWLFFFLFRTKMEDTQTGFHAFRRDAYSLLRWSSDDYSVATELAVKAVVHQMKFLEVRVTTIYYSEKQDLRILDGVKFMFLMFYWKFKFL